MPAMPTSVRRLAAVGEVCVKVLRLSPDTEMPPLA